MINSLERLGLRLKEPVGLTELLSENFNPHLHGLTKAQEDKVNALRDVVATYMSLKSNNSTFRSPDGQENLQKSDKSCRLIWITLK